MPPRKCAVSGSGAAGPPDPAKRLSTSATIAWCSSTGGGYHHVGCAIVACQIAAQPRQVKRAHGFRRAENGATNRLLRKRRFLQAIENEVIRRILGGPDFLNNHILLAPQVRRHRKWARTKCRTTHPAQEGRRP